MKGLAIVAALGSFVLTLVYLMPSNPMIPVDGATPSDWNADSFWQSNWGPSGVHKGIDIFAQKGTGVHAASSGLVIYSGNLSLGGNAVTILGAGWHVHYYAHMDTVTARFLDVADRGEQIGTVGNTGNAAGKPPHLHYSVMNLFPDTNRRTPGPEGWKRMFYKDPTTYLND